MKITVLLEALTGSFDTDIDRSASKAERRLDKMAAEFDKNFRKAAGAVIAAGAAIAAFVDHEVNAVASFERLGLKIGDTAVNVASLKTAADVSQTSMDEVAAASVRLTRSLSEIKNSSDPAARALAVIGLNLADLRKQSPVEQLETVAKRLDAFQDSASKTAVAVALFGREGANILPFLNELGGATGRVTTLTEDQIKAAANADRQFALFKSGVDNLAQAIGVELAPTLLVLVGGFDDVSKKSAETGTFIRELGTAFKGLAALGIAAVSLLEDLGNTIGGVFASASLALGGNFKAAAQAWHDSTVESEKIIEDSNKRIDAIFAAADKGPLPGLGGDQNKPKPILPTFHVESDEERHAQSIEKEVAALELKAAVLGKTERESELYRLETEKATKAELDRADAALRAIEADKENLDQLKENIKAEEDTRKAVEEVNRQYRTSEQVIADRIAYLEKLKAAGGNLVDPAAFARAEKEAKDAGDTMTEFWRKAAHNMQDALADFLFDPFKDGLDGMVENFGKMLQRLAAEAAAAQIFKWIGTWGQDNAGASGLTGIIAGIAASFSKPATTSGGAHATGGDILPSTMALVGENGPELVIPRTVSNVIPLSRLNGRGGGTTQIFNITTPDANSFRASQRQLARRAKQRLTA